MKRTQTKKKTSKRPPEGKPQKAGSRVAFDKKFMTSTPPSGISAEFWNLLHERLEFDPQCGKKYTTNVYYRVLVADCDNKTIPEILEMLQGLFDRGKASAASICSLSKGKCPDAVLTDLEITRDVCQNRLWEIDAKWTFRCLVLV